MIRLRGQMICLTGDEAAQLRAHLDDYLRITRADPACLLADIAATDDPLVFEVIESFRTPADFQAHQARSRASAWFAATRSILRDVRVEEVAD